VNVDVFRALLVAAIWLCSVLPVQAEDLLGAYQLARQHDPVLLSARHAHDAARQRLPQARAGLLPTIGLVGNSGGQSGTASFAQSPLVDRSVRSRGWSLQLSQPLWRPANRITYEQAGLQERLADEQLRQALQECMLRLAQAYFDALLAQESLRVAQGQLLAVQTQLALASRNYEVGIATVTDVHEAQARRDLAQAQVAAADNDVHARFAGLEQNLGSLPKALSTFAADRDLPPPAEDARTWVERARSQHPAVRIQEAALAVAEAEISRSEAAHGPTLDFVASYGRNFASGSMGSPADVSSRIDAAQVGVNLHIPLFAGGSVAARVRESTALRDKAADDLETARRQAATQALQAWSGIHQGRAQLVALASAVASSRSAVEDNKTGYRIGTRINIDVLNAEQQLYAAQREWFKARVETLMHGLRLKAAGGLLEEADLAAVNRLLAAAVVAARAVLRQT
jgi:outer membrane protein